MPATDGHVSFMREALAVPDLDFLAAPLCAHAPKGGGARRVFRAAGLAVMLLAASACQRPDNAVELAMAPESALPGFVRIFIVHRAVRPQGEARAAVAACSASPLR